MIGEQHKLKDLEQLKKFVVGPVVGYSSHLWYGTLRAKYPMQFLQLMGEHRNWCKSAPGLQFDDTLISEAIERINEAQTDLHAYILNPPQNEAQQLDLRRIIYILEEALLRQVKEN
jgi:hypothetical protein